jgi:hypothetical protein
MSLVTGRISPGMIGLKSLFSGDEQGGEGAAQGAESGDRDIG